MTLYLSAELHLVKSRSSIRQGRTAQTIPPEPSRNEDDNVGEDDALLGRPETPGGSQGIEIRGPPPVYLLILPYISLGLTIFIAGTRYFDFRNHGFDVLAGAATGIVTASFAFELYYTASLGSST